MALQEQHRENLLRDATAYTRRLLWRSAIEVDTAHAEPVAIEELFIGFRENGGWSIYVGEDPVLQFNAAGELRRLYSRGERYAAEGAKLAACSRDKRGGRVQLESKLLTLQQQTRVLQDCCSAVESCLGKIANGQLQLAGQVDSSDGCASTTLLSEAMRALELCRTQFAIAQSPGQ